QLVSQAGMTSKSTLQLCKGSVDSRLNLLNRCLQKSWAPPAQFFLQALFAPFIGSRGSGHPLQVLGCTSKTRTGLPTGSLLLLILSIAPSGLSASVLGAAQGPKPSAQTLFRYPSTII